MIGTLFSEKQRNKSSPAGEGGTAFVFRSIPFYGDLRPAHGPTGKPFLNIKIQEKFMRMRPQFDIVDFIFGFIFNPHVNRILGKHVTF